MLRLLPALGCGVECRASNESSRKFHNYWGGHYSGLLQVEISASDCCHKNHKNLCWPNHKWHCVGHSHSFLRHFRDTWVTSVMREEIVCKFVSWSAGLLLSCYANISLITQVTQFSLKCCKKEWLCGIQFHVYSPWVDVLEAIVKSSWTFVWSSAAAARWPGDWVLLLSAPIV